MYCTTLNLLEHLETYLGNNACACEQLGEPCIVGSNNLNYVYKPDRNQSVHGDSLEMDFRLFLWVVVFLDVV